MTEPASIDPQALDRLREWGGDKLLTQMIRLFLENSLTRMEQIREGTNGADVAQAERGAHSLKSSAANVGAEKVRNLAAEMERLATAEDREALAAILPELETAYAQARAELEVIVQGAS